MAHHSSRPPVLTVGFLWVALTLISTHRDAAGEPSATIISVEGAATTYHVQDWHGESVTVQVPSQSAADIKGTDAQGNVQATVTAIDTTTHQVKVRTSAGQTIVLAMSPASLRGLQIGDPVTFTVPRPPR
jgi:hypothetical protein